MEVSLRDVIDEDVPIFFEQQNDPVANEMAAFPARERDAFMAHWTKIRANVAGLIKTILYHGQVAGYILSFDMEEKREVGYWLGREFWGKGIASKALAQFLNYEITRPLYGVTIKHNIASQNVLKKCGFEYSGVEKDEVFFILK